MDKKTFRPIKLTQLEIDMDIEKSGSHETPVFAISYEKIYQFSAKMTLMLTTVSNLQNEVFKLQKEFDDLFIESKKSVL